MDRFGIARRQCESVRSAETGFLDSRTREESDPSRSRYATVALARTEFGDRVVFSGVVRLEPLAATIDSMLDDAAAYAAHKAHFGDPPAK